MNAMPLPLLPPLVIIPDWPPTTIPLTSSQQPPDVPGGEGAET